MKLNEAKRADYCCQATSMVDRYFEEKLADCRTRRKAAILRASKLMAC